MPDFVIRTLRGGVNNSDPSNSIPDDQATVAENVEFVSSTCGERRFGCGAIDITGSDLEDHDQVPFLFRHLPTTDETASELWAFGVTGTSSSDLCKKTTTWSTIVPIDSITITGTYQYQLRAASLHGKLFICYKSSEDRQHVYDGSSLRRAGLAEPAAPSVANTGAGSFDGDRLYRVRFTVQSGGTTLLRSEPSDATEFSPSGSGSAARITKPATISESETHWEIEASVGDGEFYVIATLAVGTTTYDDTTPFSPGYADLFDIAPDTGDYSLIPSARFVVVDDDRLVWASSFEEEDLSSRVGWTPVKRAPGVGNDERMETDTDPFVDLDGLEGGPITDMVSGIQGYIYVFKFGHIYQLVRTGQRSRAYQPYNLTKDRGAIYGSVTTGADQDGNPALYFLDPSVGPCILGKGGIKSCGADIRAQWASINLDAANVVARGCYFPKNKQVIWWIATEDSDVPNHVIVLHTNEMRSQPDGYRRGWVMWTGSVTGALTVCLYSDNIDDNDARSRSLVPFIGVAGDGLIWRLNTGTDDNGASYDATITTKPYSIAGVLNQFEIKSATILLKAVEDAALNVSIIKNYGLEELQVENVSCAPQESESQVIVHLKDLQFSGLHSAQFSFSDTDNPGERWEINEFSFRHTGGQKS